MPAHPLAPKLASQILEVVSANATQGVPLLWTLLEMGDVSPETSVGRGGPRLADRVLEMALGEASENIDGPLARAVFRSDTRKWGGPGFFALRGAGNDWVPLKWLRTLARRPKSATKGGARVIGQLDDWFAQILPLLDMNTKEKNEALAGALTLNLSRTVDLFWGQGDLLAEVDGKPVIAHARNPEAWQRFLADGGDPTHRIDNLPLWRHLVPHNPTMAPTQSLSGEVERWAWGWLGAGNGRDEDRQWLEKSIDRRLAGKGGLDARDWLGLLSATPFPGPRWAGGKDRVPAWETVARSTLDTELLDALEKSELSSRIDPAHLARVRAEVFPLRAAKASDLEEHGPFDTTPDAGTPKQEDRPSVIAQWKQFLDEGRHPQEADPAILAFVGQGLDRGVLKRLEVVAQAHPRAWWGAEEALVEEQVLDRLLQFALEQKNVPHEPGSLYPIGLGTVKTFSRLTSDRQRHPAIRLALGMLLMIRGNKDEEALGLMQGSEALLDPGTPKGAGRLATIRSLVSGWKHKRRERIETVLTAAEMDAALPQPSEPAKPKVRL